jgi:hypothetical protein
MHLSLSKTLITGGTGRTTYRGRWPAGRRSIRCAGPDVPLGDRRYVPRRVDPWGGRVRHSLGRAARRALRSERALRQLHELSNRVMCHATVVQCRSRGQSDRARSRDGAAVASLRQRFHFLDPARKRNARQVMARGCARPTGPKSARGQRRLNHSIGPIDRSVYRSSHMSKRAVHKSNGFGSSAGLVSIATEGEVRDTDR